MGLLTIIRKQNLKSRQARVLVLGLDNSGKSTVVNRWLHDDVSSLSPTLGFRIKTVVHERSQLSLNVWDVGGQRSLRAYWRNYFEHTDALVWCVDSADVDRLLDCRDALHDTLKEERLAGASLLVIANKQDVAHALGAAQVAHVLELDKLRSHAWHVQECAATTADDTRVEEALDWVADEVTKRVYYAAPLKPTTTTTTTTTATAQSR